MACRRRVDLAQTKFKSGRGVVKLESAEVWFGQTNEVVMWGMATIKGRLSYICMYICSYACMYVCIMYIILSGIWGAGQPIRTPRRS